MINIRQNIFETNSSSSHSLSISENTDGIFDTIDCDEGGVIHITGGYFGSEWDAHNDVLTKINYCATDQKDHPENLKLLTEVIKEQTCCSDVIYHMRSDGYSNASIDHESTGTSNELFIDKEKLRNFLFNPSNAIITGGDERFGPPNILDFGKNKKYKYQLKIKGLLLTYKFETYPTEKELEEAMYSIIEYDTQVPAGYMFCRYKKLNSIEKIKENIMILYKDNYDGKKIKSKELTFLIEEI
jgi:hypothetical protein